MNTEHPSTQPAYQDVRYSITYAVLTIFLALIFIAMAFMELRSRWGGPFTLWQVLWVALILLVGALVLLAGITLRSRRYFRLDLSNKILHIYGIIGPWPRKVPFDNIYLEDESFFIEKEGRKRKLQIMKYACDRDDLESLINTLKE